MKKARIISGIIMLVLCVGVLAIGIYAAKPSVNNITGSLTIVPPDAKLEITGYIIDPTDESTETTPKLDTCGINYGKTWNIEDGDIKFDLRGVTELHCVPAITIRLHLKNLSNSELGAYFYSGTGVKTGQAVVTESQDDILLLSQIKSGDITLANVTLSPYSHMMPSNTTDDYDEIDMEIRIELAKLFDDGKMGSFNYTLMIEDYVPTISVVNTQDYPKPEAATELPLFAKFASTITGGFGLSSFYDEDAYHIVIPATHTSISEYYCWANVTAKGLFVGAPVSDIIGKLNDFSFIVDAESISLKSTNNVTPGDPGISYNYRNGVFEVTYFYNYTSNHLEHVKNYIKELIIDEQCINQYFSAYSFYEFFGDFLYETIDNNIVYLGTNDYPYVFATEVVNKSVSSVALSAFTVCINNNIFSGCVNLTTLTVPASVMWFHPDQLEMENFISFTLEGGSVLPITTSMTMGKWYHDSGFTNPTSYIEGGSSSKTYYYKHS